MKTYDVATYTQVMRATTDFSPYWKYYVIDFIFIGTFLHFMIRMTQAAAGNRLKSLRNIAYGFAILRGIFDSIENILLLTVIYGYPDANSSLIPLANQITRIKFHLMRGWILYFVLLLIAGIFLRIRDNKSNMNAGK